MTFKEFLAALQVRDSPKGDVVRKFHSAPDLPDATSWGELKAYLELKRYYPDEMMVARRIWSTYQARKRRTAEV